MKVGDGVTIIVGTDRYAGTIDKISKTEKTIWATYDDAIRLDENGLSEIQHYKYETNNKSKVEKIWLRNGKWKCKIGRVIIGVRNHYIDPCF